MNQDKGVVITGSSGFIGSHLLPLLKRASEVQTIDSDIRKQDSLKSISPADVMYHLAGVMPQQGHDVQEVNVLERLLRPDVGEVALQPYEAKWVRVEF